MLKVYRDNLVGPAPPFPDVMEQRITRYLNPEPAAVDVPLIGPATFAPRVQVPPEELRWLVRDRVR
jgi:hypothetical protein